ncbi:flavoprotein WrbA, partial [Aureobasidium melanogenum]|uniref:Flavo protein WrbA n=1 Tax=Aureobasidium melanogenum (strain CBS 110374) TaxID=1043003 RepID=A0A074WEB0_AURM1
MAPHVAIVFFSAYGHISQLVEEEARGIREAGGNVTIYKIEGTPETVGAQYEVLTDPSTLEKYDGFLFGIPTRYGNWPAQFKTFWDKTGGQWQNGSFWGKYAGAFVSTGTPGGGQESTIISAMSTFVHHGMIFVPLGYKTVFGTLADLTEVRGGSPWGAGTFAGPDGSRQPSQKELSLAYEQGKAFWTTNNKQEAVGGGAPVTEPSQSTTQAPKQQTSTEPQHKEEHDKSGPCGLPVKCTIS